MRSWNATKTALRRSSMSTMAVEQRIDDEMCAVVRHAVERGAVRLDAVEHAVDDRR